eukprot:6176132-Pleurochrysis_carterae.AAC.2
MRLRLSPAARRREPHPRVHCERAARLVGGVRRGLFPARASPCTIDVVAASMQSSRNARRGCTHSCTRTPPLPLRHVLTGARTRVRRLDAGASALCLSPCHSTLVCGFDNGALRAWSLHDRKIIAKCAVSHSRKASALFGQARVRVRIEYARACANRVRSCVCEWSTLVRVRIELVRAQRNSMRADAYDRVAQTLGSESAKLRVRPGLARKRSGTDAPVLARSSTSL